MTKKTIFTILASMTVAVALSTGHADTSARPVRALTRQPAAPQIAPGPNDYPPVGGVPGNAQPLRPAGCPATRIDFIQGAKRDPYTNESIPTNPGHPIGGVCRVTPTGFTDQLTIAADVRSMGTPILGFSPASPDVPVECVWSTESMILDAYIATGVCTEESRQLFDLMHHR